MMHEGQTLTLAELFERSKLIEIPLIQRDYAQGRSEAEHVRVQFLKSIKEVLLLSSLELKQPLDLDFVYGSIDDLGSFVVLDGQQRLTTLFLLHWYLAQKASKTEHFQTIFSSQSRSKFTYKTRTSATEFFDQLVIQNLSSEILVENLPSIVIQDQQWFFQSWSKDPTVQACLNMLDAIHLEFCSCSEKLYENLFITDSPYITFQYLNLESFGLTDELYIKMNARGKPLSEFENFKACLCKRAENLPNGEEFEKKLDQNWTDIFWKLQQVHKRQFDTLYLRFFNLIAFYHACETLVGRYEAIEWGKRLWIEKLRTRSDYLEPELLDAFAILSDGNLQRIETVLDYFSEDDNRLTDLDIGLNRTDYLSLAKFYATLLFIEHNHELSFEDLKFIRWKRVTDNLLNNHRFDEMSAFLPVLRALRELSKQSDSIYEFLVNSEIERGFTADQRKEEKLKAELILDDGEWEKLIIDLERHDYLHGKVGFILENSKNDHGTYSKALFIDQAKKVSKLFSEELLKDDKHRLQRALLTRGDYTLYEKSSVYSLCSSESSTYRSRSENWFRVVNGKEFTSLLNELDSNAVIDSLESLIESADCGGWRQRLVEYPEAIAYCKNSRISIEGEDVYLLTKSSKRGYYAELNTYILYLQLLDYQGYLKLVHVGYHFVYGVETPFLYVRMLDDQDIKIAYTDGEFYGFNGVDEAQKPIPVQIPQDIKKIIDVTFLPPREMNEELLDTIQYS